MGGRFPTKTFGIGAPQPPLLSTSWPLSWGTSLTSFSSRASKRKTKRRLRTRLPARSWWTRCRLQPLTTSPPTAGSRSTIWAQREEASLMPTPTAGGLTRLPPPAPCLPWGPTCLRLSKARTCFPAWRRSPAHDLQQRVLPDPVRRDRTERKRVSLCQPCLFQRRERRSRTGLFLNQPCLWCPRRILKLVTCSIPLQLDGLAHELYGCPQAASASAAAYGHGCRCDDREFGGCCTTCCPPSV